MYVCMHKLYVPTVKTWLQKVISHRAVWVTGWLMAVWVEMSIPTSCTVCLICSAYAQMHRFSFDISLSMIPCDLDADGLACVHVYLSGSRLLILSTCRHCEYLIRLELSIMSLLILVLISYGSIILDDSS